MSIKVYKEMLMVVSTNGADVIKMLGKNRKLAELKDWIAHANERPSRRE